MVINFGVSATLELGLHLELYFEVSTAKCYFGDRAA